MKGEVGEPAPPARRPRPTFDQHARLYEQPDADVARGGPTVSRTAVASTSDVLSRHVTSRGRPTIFALSVATFVRLFRSLKRMESRSDSFAPPGLNAGLAVD